MSHTKSKLPPKSSHSLPFGFTIVELVVVITILAILGTIGFLSVGGYSSRARDSARIGDSSQIAKSLDVSIITRGDYPLPDNAFFVTYSGGIVWNQGTVSSGVMQSMKSSISGGGLNKKPIDPLDNSEYVYSSLEYGKAYQLKVNYEGDLNQTAWNENISPLTNLLTLSQIASILPEASAAPGSPTIAYIRGNYGGLMAKTVTGSITYVLAVPSIITSTGSIGSVLSINSGVLSGSLLFNGKSLKNASTYNPTTVVFSGAKLPTSDTNGEISSMMTNLKTAYSGATDISSNQNIATLLSTSTTGSLVTLGSTMITGQLGGSAVGGGGTATNTSDTTAPTITSVTATQSACNTIRFTVNGASDGGGLSTSAYSFDGGSTWQAGTFKDFSGTSYTVSASLVRVRDTAGNVYIHASGVSGSAAACCVANVGQTCDKGYWGTISGCANADYGCAKWRVHYNDTNCSGGSIAANDTNWNCTYVGYAYYDPFVNGVLSRYNVGGCTNVSAWYAGGGSIASVYLVKAPSQSYCTDNQWVSVPGVTSCNGSCQ